MNKECVPAYCRCDSEKDCLDKSDEVGCPTCRVNQFSCQSTEGRDKTLICDGTTSDNCDNVHDEADCCKRPESFSVPSTSFASAALLCDGPASDIFAHRDKNRALMAPSKKLSKQEARRQALPFKDFKNAIENLPAKPYEVQRDQAADEDGAKDYG
ncbi:low-density lipoprotein receptor-like isoform X1 [Drosophila miranda]|uniref:low-density lipoprotein receptor-like isoform X1 n=1 Tax=Drosophila miranda TaxID=7229 RepID=UPI00143F135C|nr:low-density lipoprotein receptor-like isoform X1 [Drosophila miranda]